MERDEYNKENLELDESTTAVNSLILDYYKKFGRKRDLEQFFSLSTAETEIRDVKSLFWRRMKSQDSSDGEKKSESSTELCRISIKCSMPDPSSSQDENTKSKSDSDSPPIITEDVETKHTDEESVNEDNQSQISMDALRDISMNRALSPTSSITSQRKLEWDSLADVGYDNECERKTSASSLSTLERLALKQQYSNNDSKHDTEIGHPTAHSTPVDLDIKSKPKGGLKKTTKIYKKDIDIVEVNLPHASNTSPSQAINVNLTKHISFNMDKDGGLTVKNVTDDVNLNPEKHSFDAEKHFETAKSCLETENKPPSRTDKEIQTSLTKTKDTSVSPDLSKSDQISNPRIPILINLNTLRRKYRRKKPRLIRKKLRTKRSNDQENIPIQEKSTEQVSAAESFEYLPGHVYNQNQITLNQPGPSDNADNKSSLESSGAATTDSSKGSKHSFTKDLQKGVEILQAALHKQKHNNSELKTKLVREVVQRLLKAKYRDDESTTDFLSGLSFNSKKLGLGESRLTTSTSDSNNTEINNKPVRPKKSILRLDKFNSNVLTSNSQSAPNLPSVINQENTARADSLKQLINKTESDVSSGGKHSSDAVFIKTSSEELYQKYLEALKREEAYKKHLRDKQIFLKQKLVSSELPVKLPRVDKKIDSKLKDLIKDLTRNNYDDGSGDASKLEGGDNSNLDFQRFNAPRSQRSHSVFTLSSGNSEHNNRKANLKKRLQKEIKQTTVVCDRDDHRCFCAHRFIAPKVGVTDSSVQVNLKVANANENSGNINLMSYNSHGINRESLENIAHVVADELTGDIKYVCLCGEKSAVSQEVPNNMLIYKCSRLMSKGIQLEEKPSKTTSAIGVQSVGNRQTSANANHCIPSTSKVIETQVSKQGVCHYNADYLPLEKTSKSSQTNIALRLIDRKSSEGNVSSSSSDKKSQASSISSENPLVTLQTKKIVYESTRCIQTEISIDPKISDPSLTDINLIAETDCAKLVCEGYKQISRRNSDSNIKLTSPQVDSTDSKRSTQKLASTFLGNYIYSDGKTKLDNETKIELNNNHLSLNPMLNEEKISSDNFTIPIQGTNMTLMVKIGSTIAQNKKDLDKDNTKSECVGTEQRQVTEKATCLTEECSKAVQSCTTDIFTGMGDIFNLNVISAENSKANNLNDKNGATSSYRQNQTKLSAADGRGSTFPRQSQPIPKPLLRTNTDMGKFMSTSHVQTDNIEKSDAVTQETNIQPTEQVKDSDSNVSEKSETSVPPSGSSKVVSSKEEKYSSSDAQSRKISSGSERDPVLDIIKDITKRFSKKEMEKGKRKKCYKEIMKVLNYLLDTEDGTDVEQNKSFDSSSIRDTNSPTEKKTKEKYSSLEKKTTKDKHSSPESLIEKNAQSSVPKKEIESDERSEKNNVYKSKTNNRSNKIESPTKQDKAVQSSPKRSNIPNNSTGSSEIPVTTEFPSTSSDSATCKVLNKIKRECEKYHQKRCKSHNAKKCDASSSTSVNCERCKRVHHCSCRGHRCHRSQSEKLKKKCVAYNLIIQTSDSMISEETIVDKTSKPIPNVIVKVPHKRKHLEKVPFKEVFTKIEKTLPSSPRGDSRACRSRSWPNESGLSTNDDYTKRNCGYSVREYLEVNRPDFVEKCSTRQHCLKTISEKREEDPCVPPNLKMVVVHTPTCVRPVDACNMYCGGVPMNCNPFNPYMQCAQTEVTRIANERAAQRQLLSMQLDRHQLSSLSETELRRLAKELGVDSKRKKLAPKFISEQEMKKHSEKIYKSLPEVVQKKEDAKKENMKKTNLLMANIFKKNLQKKTLRGSVNLSNYSTVIKI